jgi:ribosomal protein L11 methyltransferase
MPAQMAFGTGEHPTTAMSLRLLEQLTRRWKRGWSVVDLGTGSGILALTPKRFGAGDVVGMDNDPAAISTAKSNARLNKIHGVVFRFGDALKREWPRNADVITANLYSHLLIEIVPKLNPGRWLIFSGILRSQKDAMLRAMQRNDIEIRSINYRGKWDRHPGVF